MLETILSISKSKVLATKKKKEVNLISLSKEGYVHARNHEAEGHGFESRSQEKNLMKSPVK